MTNITMDLPILKERAYSLASYLDKKRPFDSSPEMRPVESNDNPPPISLSPSILESSKILKELKQEKEQDQYLISVLKKHCFEQSKEILKLKNKLESLQKDYESLLRSPDKPEKISIIELARSRSESLHDSV